MNYQLENEYLQVSLVPQEGGRISSLKSLESGAEFLLQAAPDRDAIEPSMHANFAEGACAGIEECLPSVGACGSDAADGAVPDHGDFWQLAWELVEPPKASSCALSATGFSRPLRFSKRVSLRERSLDVSYAIENIGSEPVSFLYACHPLFAVSEDDRVILPGEVTSLRLQSSRGDRLGAPGDRIDWPLTQELPGVDLSRVLAETAGTGDMLYTAELRRGRCGLYRTAFRQGILLHFDTARLPYLGCWLCYGGWPEQGQGVRQYAVALEPTNAPYGTLTQAQQSGQALMLAAGQIFSWTICFEVSAPGLSLSRFQREVSALEMGTL